MKIKHLRSKYFLFISLIIISIVAVLGTITVSFFSNALLKEVKTIAAQKMQIISIDLEEELKYIINVAEKIKNNQELEKQLKINTKSEEELYEKMRNISNITRDYAYADVGINSIFIMDTNNRIYDPFYMISPYKEIVEQYEEYNKFIKSNEYSAYSAPTNFPSKSDKEPGNKNSITYFEKYLSKQDYKQVGTVLINVKIDYLFQTFRNACKSEFYSAYIADKKNGVIYKVEEGRESLNINKIQLMQDDTGIINFNNVDYYFIKEDLKLYPDWQLIGIMEYNSLKTNINIIKNYFYIITFISIIFILFLSYIFSNKITKPILEIKNSMDVLAMGEWPEPMVASTHDEIKDLIEGYNHMLDEQQKLIEQIYKEQEEKKIKELETVRLKLDLLHSQINPHFIHNTLHAMQYLLKTEKTEELMEMLVSFNRLLRFNMAIDKAFITIEEERLCIESYIKILECRYDKEFEIIYDIPEEINSLTIPKLILQPLIENAIFHGIIPKGSGGRVELSMKKKEASVYFCVKDNGIGIEENKIESILNNKQEGSSSSLNQIGIHNIDKRLRLLYGEGARLKITSKVNEGTKVYFEIPLEALH